MGDKVELLVENVLLGIWVRCMWGKIGKLGQEGSFGGWTKIKEEAREGGRQREFG